MQKVVDELTKYGLTTEDLSQEELAEMLEEAEMREDPKITVLDGYFGHPITLMNIKAEKTRKELGF